MLTLFALFHVLVFVYWLGGDLGAFYTSYYLTKPDIPANERLLAARIVGAVDLAPRFALIATLPTGLWLAVLNGWIDIPTGSLYIASGLAIAWAALAWELHKAHGAHTLFKKIDLAVRFLLVAGIFIYVGLAQMGALSAALPLFIAVKLVCFASAIALGLFVRRLLAPLGPGLADLMSADLDQQSRGAEGLRVSLERVRPCVNLIWVLLLIAAYFGLATPV